MLFISRVCPRMASPQTLNLLQTQAARADTVLAELRSQISVLKEAAVSYIGKNEIDQLRKENDLLKQEVEQAKIQLIMAEIYNGVRQVFVPSCTHSTSKTDSIVKPDPEKKVNEEKPKSEKKTEKAKDVKTVGKKPAKTAEDKIDISQLDLRIGKIVSVKKHPDADSLYVEEVDVGEDKKRTVVSGLVKFITLEQMQDRMAVFMCNLKPVKMRGILSEGMVMCASTSESVEILIPPAGVVPGDQISFDGYPGEPDAQLNPKKKIWESLKPFVRTDDNKVATFKGVPFKVEGKGIVVTETLANAQIS